MNANRRVLLFADFKADTELLVKHLQGVGFFAVQIFDCSFDRLLVELDEYPDCMLFVDAEPSSALCASFIQSLRDRKISVPLIHLIRTDHYLGRIRSLQNGADDVLSFPFALEELDARIEALIRRSTMGSRHSDGKQLRHRDLQLNTDTREVSRAGIVNKLTVKEYDLLVFMMQRPHQILGRKAILHGVWGQSWTGDDNLLEVYVRYLRKKIEHPSCHKILRTVRGVGYVLD